MPPPEHCAPAIARACTSPDGWRGMLRFAGPGYLVAVGYMDPGNWATDLAGGSAYGYRLLWVIAMSSCMAVLLQILASRLGLVAGMDLAQACRHRSPRLSALAQWVLCEIAICAADLAEVLGTAIALNLLFGLPLAWGVALTVFDVLLVLVLQQRGYRRLEAFVISMVALVLCCFILMLLISRPAWPDVAAGLVPYGPTMRDPSALYIAIGIIGATVMPHNLYLHSAAVRTRALDGSPQDLRRALRFIAIDTVIALSLAFVINAAILITAAGVFFKAGRTDVAEIQEAYRLLSPLTGAAWASVVFGVALLASGQCSAVTATLAGQVVMEGFLRTRLPPWLRRLATRCVAIVPALVVAILYAERGIAQLLLASQVILSLQLPFAAIPLVRSTSSCALMREHVNPRWLAVLAWIAVAVIVSMNATMLWMLAGSPAAGG
ncbi:Nramp family divalent metal transporter [Cupriavidus necator]|uniref:Divalent metal cation transporter MntH n=1 Tax=Cupriavidus pinatubonensis (strain JMP 134 / LMG 1197) TaxID=264198 RepID=Q46SX2_CUPPJ|nr:Nramp family divalent metal transporter [Cupriavidus necator]